MATHERTEAHTILSTDTTHDGWQIYIIVSIGRRKEEKAKHNEVKKLIYTDLQS
jgi:hypothetical protein